MSILLVFQIGIQFCLLSKLVCYNLPLKETNRHQDPRKKSAAETTPYIFDFQIYDTFVMFAAKL